MIHARLAIPRMKSDRLWMITVMKLPSTINPASAQRLRADRASLCSTNKYARLNTKGIKPMLVRAGYLPQSTACAGIYQPQAETTTAKMAAQLELVRWLTGKKTEMGMAA